MTKKAVLWAVCAVFTAAVLAAGVTAAGAGDVVPAAEAVKYLDKNKYTSAEIKDYYKGLKGKTIKGSGTVNDIRETKKNIQVNVLVTGTKSHKGFNLVVVTNDEAAKGFHKNDAVTFEGEFERIMPFSNDHVVVVGTAKKGK